MDDKERRRAFEAEKREQLKRRTRLLKDTNGEIVRLLNEALERIHATLAAQPSDYQRWYLPQLQKEIQQTLAQMSDGAGAEVSKAAGRAWELGEQLVDAPLEAAGIRVQGVAPVLDTRQLFAMRAFMTDRIKDIGVQAANRINSELGLVVIGAQTPSEANTRITEILGEPSRARATRIIRTELNRAYAAASQQRMEQASQFVKGLRKRWRRSGKKHPRPHHSSAHGQVQDIDKPFTLVGRKGLVKLMYPRDPRAPAGETINCGCDSVPFMASWDAAA